MIILPAIDLYEKKAVRLYKGDYSKMTCYSEDPPKLAQEFREAGAEWLHMVDLEGARCGGTPNFDIAAKIIRTSGLLVELGGGIRDEETVQRYLDAGVNRVILGTAAASNIRFVADMVAKYGSAIAVGVDLRDGMVAVKGWTETTGLSGLDYCKSLEEIGVSTVICTDISRDGAMAGANGVTVNVDGKPAAIVDLRFTESVEKDEAIRLTPWERFKRAWYMANKYGYSYYGHY